MFVKYFWIGEGIFFYLNFPKLFLDSEAKLDNFTTDKKNFKKNVNILLFKEKQLFWNPNETLE